MDPMYANFDVDERTVQRVKQLVREGKLESNENVEVPVWLGLATEHGFPRRGTINFVDNQVNPRTGTLRVRGVFPNADGLLSPGFFARVRVPISAPHKALLVSERALGADQGQQIVYVVGADTKVAVRPVQLGALHDGLREITDGLQADDQVIVNGVLHVRPGLPVTPQPIEMPRSTPGSAKPFMRPMSVASNPETQSAKD
jgi:RND family efflux transporter MFP subunit